MLGKSLEDVGAQNGSEIILRKTNPKFKWKLCRPQSTLKIVRLSSMGQATLYTKYIFWLL